jgi:6-phosphogluconate dehydrogenase
MSMSSTQYQFGLVGLAVMGQNLALNIESRGYSVAVYNRTAERTREFAAAKIGGRNMLPTYSPEEFVAALERPRKIMLMVKAGKPVDETIEHLKPLLETGDLLIDGGNSFFGDTERRSKEMESAGLLYIGTGVSGGEEGALKGPSIMPGGQPEAYAMIEDMLKAIAAKVDGDPCVSYIGPRGAGHYVKMVHNGIEYGDMQLISEAYDILHRGAGFSAPELHAVFSEWNKAELSSYLIEITADIFRKVDAETGRPLVDLILDEAEQKGTGKWTSQNALDLGVPTPTINAAVEGRLLSAFKKERVAASKVLSGPVPAFAGDGRALAEDVRQALYASKICSYAQGMALLRAASHEYAYNLRLDELARIWRGGCIIRARLLGRIRDAFLRNPDLPNLLMDDEFREAVQSRQEAWRRVVKAAVDMGIPCAAMGTSLAYFDAYRSERLPANLLQAQRDYFGAHTYKRVDRPGSFHTEWLES